jgi:hypothetical protein
MSFMFPTFRAHNIIGSRQSSLYKALREKVPVTPHLTTEFIIIGLHVIDPGDSRGGVQLMAVSSSGIRLFFGPSLDTIYRVSYHSCQSLLFLL